MQKYYSGAIVNMTGSHTAVERTIWTDGGKYYVRWYGNFIEVTNVWGIAKVTMGWRTVEEY